MRRKGVQEALVIELDFCIEAAAHDEPVGILAVRIRVVCGPNNGQSRYNHEAAVTYIRAVERRIIVLDLVQEAGFSCKGHKLFSDFRKDAAKSLLHQDHVVRFE